MPEMRVTEKIERMRDEGHVPVVRLHSSCSDSNLYYLHHLINRNNAAAEVQCALHSPHQP